MLRIVVLTCIASLVIMFCNLLLERCTHAQLKGGYPGLFHDLPCKGGDLRPECNEYLPMEDRLRYLKNKIQ